MTTALIQSLIPYLPRYAEEEGDFYSVTREALIDGLCLQQTLDRVVAENTVALIEALLDTLAVLSSHAKVIWSFSPTLLRISNTRFFK